MSFVHQKQKERRENNQYMLKFFDYSLRKREKKQRITSALQPPMQEGRLFFDPDMQSINYVEGEVLDHPNTSRDHAIDALSEIDDPVVSRVPKHKAPEKKPETEYRPDKEDMPPDQLFKKQQAKSIFEHARNEPSRKKKEKPGARVP